MACMQDTIHTLNLSGFGSLIGTMINKSIVDGFMHSARVCSTAPLQQPVDWVEFRPGSSLLSLSNSDDKYNSLTAESLSSSSLTDNAHPARPFAIRGAMQEGWPAAEWTPGELLERCGDCEVPVEVSSGGGDYRDAYDDAKSEPGRTFDAGVPVPLSLLLDAMQSTLVRPSELLVLLTHNDALVPNSIRYLV